ncbi:Putative_phosphate transporter [Hexamita inflata]|uniref:Phosphate transporter n=1 Tax=Hexamita inflata TaxID=28002 RepID=A0AA86R4N6_9EUKA|nr:Putative phosphate transporter [Hexamita inflata]
MLAYTLAIITPIYVTGSSQTINPRTIWAKLQINMVQDGSLFCFIPIIVCFMMSISLMRFYKEFQVLYIYYKQLVLRRAAPQNYTILLDCIPKELQFEQQLIDALSQCYPAGQVMRILPIPINNIKLYWKNFHLKRHIRKEQRMARHVFIWKAKVQYFQTLLYRSSSKKTQTQLENALKKLNMYKQVHFKKQKASKKLKSHITKIVDHEQIKVDYLRSIDQMYPPFPDCVKSFTVLDHQEVETKNTVCTGREGQREIDRDTFHKNRIDAMKTPDPNRPIGSACFVIFKSQKEASLASQACLFSDNTEPTIRIAPHPEEVIWYNIGAQKQEQFWYDVLFWFIMVLLFIAYFIPQTFLLGYFSQHSTEWFNAIYKNVCEIPFECKANPQQQGEKYKDFDNIGCFICYEGSSAIITYFPSIVSAIFMSCLPQLINALLFIPKYKTMSQRYKTKYVVLLTFLILIQGFLSVVLGAAFNDNGILQIDALFKLSFMELFSKIGQNISAQSFVFLNYVMTKYFFFAILTITRIPDVLLTLCVIIFRKDALLKARTYRYKNFDYVTNLCYVTHMMVIGLMYSLVSPITLLVICIALTAIVFVSRYNILFVHQQHPQSDLSSQQDLFITVLQNFFLGFILMVVGMFSYVIVQFEYHKNLIMLILAVNVIYLFVQKYAIDKKFINSLKQLKLGGYEANNMCENPFLDKLKLETVSYIKRTSVLYKEYVTGIANRESLENYELNTQDVDHVACYYTHPAIGLLSLYPGEKDDWYVI